MIPISQNALISQEQMDVLRERVFELLWQKGVTIDHPEILRLLGEKGAHVNFSSKLVRFPREFLEKILELAPKRVMLAGADSAYDLEVPRADGTFYLRTGTGARSFLQPEGNVYRKTMIADVAEWARLANQLDQIGFSAFPFPTDVPVETADIHALRVMLQNSQKHVWVQPYSPRSIEYLIELATVAAGGDDLKNRPLISFTVNALTPLQFKFMDLEIIFQACRRGIPIHAASLPSAGGTAPITMPGVVLLSAAEIITLLTVAQVVRPGTAVIALPIIFATDMKTGRSLQSSPEAMQGAALAVRFIKSAFGLPTHTYGSGADSPNVDGQSMIERSLLGVLVAAAGADILGGAGQFEVATAISPVQLVIDNEVAGMIRRMISGLTIDEETMAWDDLRSASSSGHFLETDHTLRHCRDAFKPQIFVRQSRQMWTKQGEKDFMARAAEHYRLLSGKGQPRDLPAEMMREMDRIVESADWHLKK